MYGELDPILNQRVRLAIVSILLKVQSADFNYLREHTNTTKGNLSHQLKKLKESGYISITKKFINNYPNTSCKITEKGRNAFEKYAIEMKKYLNIQ